METRDRVHALIDELSEHELQAAERILTRLHRIGEDPVLYALESAPDDDEPEKSDEQAAVAEAYEALTRGDVVSDDEIRRELGL